jgi:VanZ family protein
MYTLHPDPPRRSTRLWGGALALVSAVAILLLTLTPAGPEHQLPLRLRLCLVCGEFGLANLLRNVVLFVPLGAGLALVYARPLRAWIPAILLTAFIETAQIFIPGRNPLPADFLANAAGGGLGVLFVMVLRESLRGAPAPPSVGSRGSAGDAGSRSDEGSAGGAASIRAPGAAGGGRNRMRAGAALWVALPFLVLLGTAYAFRIAPPPPPHHVQIAPNLGHLDAYRGEVGAPVLSGETLRVGRHPDPAFLEAALFGGGSLEVEVGPAPLTRRVAPMVSIYTADQRELFLLGVQQEDVVLRLPFRAASLGLHHSDLRLEGGRAAIGDPGQTRVGYRMVGAVGGVRDGAGSRARAGADGGAMAGAQGGACLEVGAVRSCGLRPGLGEGWSLLYYPDAFTGRIRTLLGWGWILGLGVLPGLLAGSRRSAAVLGVALAGTAALSPALLGSFAATGVLDLVLLGVGVGAGAVAREILSRRR